MGRWETGTAVPAARSEGLLIERVGDETVIYDTESKQAHCLKRLAAVVFDCSDGHATIGDIAMTAGGRIGDPVTEADVADAVAQLESIGLLQTVLIVRDGDHLEVSSGNGVSRREMIRRVAFAGAGAAVGTSLVTSVMPSIARAVSGLPTGCSGCTSGSDCASGLCCATLFACGSQPSCCVGALAACRRINCTCADGAPCGAAGGFECRHPPCTCTCISCDTSTHCATCPCSECPSGSSSLNCCGSCT